MKKSKILFDDFIREISLDDKDEIMAVGYIVFQHFFKVSRTDILMGKPVLADEISIQNLKEVLLRINRHEPVQYILGLTTFYGRNFAVNPNVLVPRPETEELVHHLVNTYQRQSPPFHVLDIGTGSGCIPITLKLEIPSASVSAIDISDGALSIARENAAALQADVNFFKCDILQGEPSLKDVDLIVSNPPYIADEEKEHMHRNVLAYEPHLALFVEGDDPLLFYKVIAQKSRAMLRSGGSLWFEINARFGAEVKRSMEQHGFVAVEIMKDVTGKERFVRGEWRPIAGI